MADSVLYNSSLSTVTRHPFFPSISDQETSITLTSYSHLDNILSNHSAESNNNSNDNFSWDSPHLFGPPSWLDRTAFGPHVEFYYLDEDVHYLALPWVREPNFVPLVVVHMLTFLLGIAGNALVISVLCCGRPGRCVTFPCLLSMAVADVLFLAVCVPHEVMGHFLTHWKLSTFLCKLSGFVEMACALAAVLNLILISMERMVSHYTGDPFAYTTSTKPFTARYFVIAHPLMSKSLCTTRKAKIALIATWVAAFLLSTPAFVVMGTEVNVYYNNSSHAEVCLCGDLGLGSSGRLAWALWQMLLLFVLPALLLLFCYIRVILILWTSTRQLQNMTGSRYTSANSSSRNGSREASSTGWKVHGADRSLLATSSSSATHPQHSTYCTPGEEALQARKQVIRMLVVIIVVFLVCWGPHLIINTLKRFELNVYTPHVYHIWVMFSCLPYIQSVINPVIYVLMSKKIRESICSIPCVRCLLACRARGHHHVRHSTTHELLTAANHNMAVTGMKTSLETMRSYGASELTDV